MNAEIINSAIDIGSMLIGCLIAYGIIPLPIPENKIETWKKIQKILKVVGPLGLLSFILVALMKVYTV